MTPFGDDTITVAPVPAKPEPDPRGDLTLLVYYVLLGDGLGAAPRPIVLEAQ